MNEIQFVYSHPTHQVAANRTHLPLGRYLVRHGVISQAQLVLALQMQVRLKAPLGEILIAEGWAQASDIQTALSRQYGMQIADFNATPPDPDLMSLRPHGFWLRHRAVPWIRLGQTLLIAVAHPQNFDALCQDLGSTGLTPVAVLAGHPEIEAAVARHFAPAMATAAETRVPALYSCRNWHASRRTGWAICSAGLVLAAILNPLTALSVSVAVAVLTLVLFMMLRASAFAIHLLGRHRERAPVGSQSPPHSTVLPKISVLVPLYKEREIASALISRLCRLTYPKVLLDVLLVLEESDTVTRETVARTALPNWMRVIKVPAGSGLTTKPRAMNYALDFCRGDIIGIWDAEDAPLPDQLEHVALGFADADDDVACLQGVLDYYNPRSSWRARCFTIEYAGWFRIVLKGIAQMRLVVPLGGTTCFFRRDILENLGGWDAHNVTEDADLGLRLCRDGYRTEHLDSVTYEEANFRAIPWIRQRSRWLKGFMVTYLVHMRSPHMLLRDLGWRRFLGVQAFFLGTLAQFLLAPVIWSFWLMMLGAAHPLDTHLPAALLWGCVALFCTAEILSAAIGATAVASRHRRFLIGWVPTMILYFPLGVLAAYKALFELAVAPFFWDKTRHGQADEEPDQL